MKHTEEEIEVIAKSMYKAVKKALAAGISSDAGKKAGAGQKKDALDDLMDDNYIAEAKDSSPPMRTANMNKSKGVEKLKSFKKKIEKKQGRCWEGYEPTPGKKAYSDGSCKPKK